MRNTLQSRLIALLVPLALSVQAVISAPLSAAATNGPHHTTTPSRVTSTGLHLSHHLHPRDTSHDLSSSSSSPSNHEDRVYIKLTAFEKTLYLNLSANSEFLPGGVVVEVAREDGSVERRGPSQNSCHYVGHIHHSVLPQEGGEEGGLGGAMEGSWAAVSTCNGLHGVISTAEDRLFIEPAHLSDDDTPHSRHTHTITKSTSSPSLPPTECTASEFQEESHTPASSNVGARRRRLATANTETFVETVVVTDQSMLEDHQLLEDLEAYVFTLMNIVSHLYRDASIGHRVKVALLRVVMLESEQNFSKVGVNDGLLDQFCEWVGNHEEANAWHHDIAVLLTKQVICDGGNNCNTLGVANIGSACKTGQSCSVSRDSGLSTAFTIAHEMGHNLGMKHDGTRGPHESCDAGEQFIMAPSFAESANPHIWSECSRHQLADFLSSPKSSCLTNRPPETAEMFSDSLLLPGMEYTPTEQCRLHLGSSASYCSGRENECASMWCRADNNSACRNLVTPLTPGTECSLSADEKGVCHQGECVTYQEVASPVEGGWGRWEEWTNCSLPCGTGIQHRDRTCNSPTPRYGGHYCLGEKRSYRTCNLHVCDQGEGDVRQRYCENNPPSPNYSWETVSLDRISHLGLDMCRSHCVPVDAGHNIIHSSTLTSLPNGTPCLTSHARSQGVCLSGKCKPIGCTGELGVESRRDKCGVWCGSGDSCLSVAGSFSEVHTPETYQYYQAVIIPSGSTHISVSETTPSLSNYIALEGRHTGDSFNRQFQIMTTSQRVLAGSLWTYERLVNGAESLHSDGPIDEDVVVYLLAYYEYDGIDFTFNPPKADLGRLGATVHSWISTQWRACDAECGSGLQERGVACWEMSLGGGGGVREVDDEKCGSLQRPMSERECVMEPCQYKWVESEWDPCSVSCGGGVQVRELTCVWVEDNVEVNRDLCHNETTPTTTQPCQQEACPPEYQWRHGEWGACDVVCGEGWMEREVWCEGEQGTVGNESCHGDEKPPYKVICHAPQVCSNFHWTLSDWSECDGSCGGEGQQVRMVTCQHENGTQVEAEFCSQRSSLPATERICTPECPTTPTTDTPTTTPTTDTPTTTPTTDTPTTTPTTDTPTTTPTPTVPCTDMRNHSFCTAVLKYNVCDQDSLRTICCASCSNTLT